MSSENNGTYPDVELETPAKNGDRPTWTIMIYMAGDNNLSVDMAYALQDIRKAASNGNKNINVMAFYDGNALNTPTLYCDFTNPLEPEYVRLSTVTKRYSTDASRHRPNEEDENTATMYSLMNFVDWCINKRGKKADRYALIVSGHGYGFQSISFLKDDTSDYYMTIRKFRASLDLIRKDITKQELDLVGFDCCVMSMLEVGYEIQKCAKTMIASEGSIPNAGWTYASILKDVATSSTPRDCAEVAKSLVHNFIDTQKEFSIGGVSVDMSAWQLSNVEDVVAAVNDLGESLLIGLLLKSPIRRSLHSGIIQAHCESQSYMFEQSVDLKDFCQQLLVAIEGINDDKFVKLSDKEKFSLIKNIKTNCQRVMEAIDNCILQCGFSGGDYQFSNGISIFFPWTYKTYLFSVESYRVLNFAKSGGKNWNAFLLHFLRDTTLRGQNAQIGRHNADLPWPGRSVLKGRNRNRIIKNPADKVIEDMKTRIIQNPANRIIQNPANRIIQNPANRIVENSANRIIANPQNRIIANPQNRMLAALAGLSQADFKNTAMPWNIYGFTKEIEGVLVGESFIRQSENR